MPIEPLPILLEEEEQKAIEKLKAPESIVVRYGFMKQIGEFPFQGNDTPGCGTKMVIKSPRGVEIADMLTVVCGNAGCGHSVSRNQMLDYIENSGGKQYPFTTDGKVLRVATIDDLNEQASLDASKPQYIRLAKKHIKELNLDMKLIDAEILLGGDRVIFYFTAENRIDFRDLVKQLATECHSRIEMRQVGARDEARIIADYEKCGQQCCCKQFLKVLKPISMRSAKIQKATLDPTKISGRCGRLMCCLRYEDETYDKLRKNLPNRNAIVNTEDGLGHVINSQILTQLVLVELEADGKRQAYPVEHIERVNKDDVERIRAEILEKQQQARADRSAERFSRQQSEPKPQAKQSPPQNQPQHDQASPDNNNQESDSPTKRRRRRRKRSASQNQNNPTQQNHSEPQRPKPGAPLQENQVQSKEGTPSANINPDGNPQQQDQPNDGQPRKRKRRRRRRSKNNNPDQQSGGSQNPPPQN